MCMQWCEVQWSALISLTNNNTTRGAPPYITKDFNEPSIAARQPKIQEDCVTLRFIKWIQTRPAHSRQLSMFFTPAESVLSVGFARSVMAYDKKVLQMCKNSKKKAFLISLFFSIPRFLHFLFMWTSQVHGLINTWARKWMLIQMFQYKPYKNSGGIMNGTT